MGKKITIILSFYPPFKIDIFIVIFVIILKKIILKQEESKCQLT